jgi:hypothetical protein
MSKRSRPTPAPQPSPPAKTGVGVPSPAPGTPLPPSADAIVGEEWRRIETARVAGELDEARHDVAAAILAPVHQAPPRYGAGLWGALAAALLAGTVFALAVNLLLGFQRPEPPAPSVRLESRPPSESEKGPGIGADGEGESDGDGIQPVDSPTSQPAPAKQTTPDSPSDRFPAGTEAG